MHGPNFQMLRFFNTCLEVIKPFSYGVIVDEKYVFVLHVLGQIVLHAQTQQQLMKAATGLLEKGRQNLQLIMVTILKTNRTVNQ